MALFKRRVPTSTTPTAFSDPFAEALAARYQSVIESFQGSQKGLLRLVTGGPLQWTRPIAVSWKTDSESGELYRGNPNFDGPAMADAEAKKTIEQFDQHVARLRQDGWRLVGMEGRNLFFERG